MIHHTQLFESSRSSMRACGVDLKGNEAIFAVVDVDDAGNLTFVPTTTKKIVMGEDHDAKELVNFRTAVQAYLQENGVSLLVIKDRPRNGAMSAGAATFKMETIIQLIDGVGCHFLWGANVTKFLKKEQPSAPPQLNAYQRDAYFAVALHFKAA